MSENAVSMDVKKKLIHSVPIITYMLVRPEYEIEKNAESKLLKSAIRVTPVAGEEWMGKVMKMCITTLVVPQSLMGELNELLK